MNIELGRRASARAFRVAAIAAVFVVAGAVVACGGDDDDDDASATPGTPTATFGTRTATASGTPTIREIRNAEGTVIATEVVPAGSGGPAGAGGTAAPGATVAPGSTQPAGATAPPGATQPPGAQPTTAPGLTPVIGTVPAGRVAAVSLDSNPTTPGVDRGPITVTTGQNFDVQVVVTPPEPYQGYQYRIFWREDTMSYVSERTLTPGDLGLCAEVTTRLSNLNDGIYGGCLRTAGETNFAGPVTVLTLRCDVAGTHRLLTLTLAEGPFGTSLLNPGGVEFASQIDEGFDVICT